MSTTSGNKKASQAWANWQTSQEPKGWARTDMKKKPEKKKVLRMCGNKKKLKIK